MDSPEADILAFMSVPKDHRAKIHCIDASSASMARSSRRTDVVGVLHNDNARYAHRNCELFGRTSCTMLKTWRNWVRFVKIEPVRFVRSGAILPYERQTAHTEPFGTITEGNIHLTFLAFWLTQANFLENQFRVLPCSFSAERRPCVGVSPLPSSVRIELEVM